MIELENDQEQYRRLSPLEWDMMLLVAKQLGWVPAGTCPPEGLTEKELWDGNYQSNDGQVFSGADLILFRAALSKLSADIPEHALLCEATAREAGMDEADAADFVPHFEIMVEDLIDFCDCERICIS